MIETIIEFFRYWTAFLFGIMVAVSFIGMRSTQKNT